MDFITNFLRKQGYTKKYGEWHDSSVKSVLFTELYTGTITWKGQVYPGKHKPLVSLEEFEKVKQLRKERVITNPRYYTNPFKRTSLLGGLIWCGNCGARYYTKTNTVKRGKTTDPNKKPLRYYTCYSRGKTAKNMIKDPTCKNPSFNMQKLDEIILGEVRKLAIDEDYFKSLRNNSETKNKPLNLDILKERIKDIDKQTNKLIDLYQLGNIDFNTINQKVDKLAAEKLNIESEIDNLNKTDISLNKDEIKGIIVSIPSILENSSMEQIQSLVHSLIESITIYKDAIEIRWRF